MHGNNDLIKCNAKFEDLALSLAEAEPVVEKSE